MDNRLKLTAEQKEIVEKYNKVCAEMEDAGIFIIERQYGEAYAMNVNSGVDVGFSEDGGELVSVDDLESIECPVQLSLNNEETDFSVSFND